MFVVCSIVTHTVARLAAFSLNLWLTPFTQELGTFFALILLPSICTFSALALLITARSHPVIGPANNDTSNGQRARNVTNTFNQSLRFFTS